MTALDDLADAREGHLSRSEDRARSRRARRNAELIPALVELWWATYEVYGSRRLCKAGPALGDRHRPRPDHHRALAIGLEGESWTSSVWLGEADGEELA